jgi:hypothetical protein
MELSSMGLVGGLVGPSFIHSCSQYKVSTLTVSLAFRVMLHEFRANSSPPKLIKEETL